MIDSGEAESRAVAGAVKGAIGQARLDAGVNITGLLVDIGSAESVDYRQHLMCWHLTRVLRPSLTEEVSPAVVRSVVEQEMARSRTVPLGSRSWRAGSSPLDLWRMQIHGQIPAGPAGESDEVDVVGDAADAGFQHRRWTRATSAQELCRTRQHACP